MSNELVWLIICAAWILIEVPLTGHDADNCSPQRYLVCFKNGVVSQLKFLTALMIIFIVCRVITVIGDAL